MKKVLVLVLVASGLNAGTHPVSYDLQRQMWTTGPLNATTSPGNILQRRAELVRALNKEYEKYKKDKEAGPQNYMGGEFYAREGVQHIKQQIEDLGGRVQKSGDRYTVVWQYSL